MKLVLVLLALIGSAVALVPGTEYTYNYEGRLGIGIPEIRNRVSGTGIKCLVRIQVQSNDKAVLRLENIKTGEFVGDVDCELRNPMDIRYVDISGEGKLLEEPFEVHFKKNEGDVMVVSKSDREWLTNIRKSIADLFLIEPIRSNFGDRQDGHSIAKSLHGRRDEIPTSFYVTEPSIFGKCRSDYTLVPLQDRRRVDNPTSKDDKQRYAMRRSIQFHRCDDRVLVQQAGLGNTTDVKNNLFGDVVSRSSNMFANLTYENKKYKLLDSSIEGTFSINPFGINQDKLISVSNQTCHLVSEAPIEKNIPIDFPTKSIHTWLMEFWSPYGKGSDSPIWMNFYKKSNPVSQPLLLESVATGMDLKEEDIEKFRETMDKLLDEAAKMMLEVGPPPVHGKISPVDTEEGDIVTHMESCQRLANGIDEKNHQVLFEQYYNDKSEKGQLKLRLFIDSCSASGGGSGLKVLVQEMAKGRITPERAASVFFTLPNNLGSTPIIRELTEYVKTLSLDTHPFVTSTVWINFASTLNKACLHRNKYIYSVPHALFGSESCKPKDVINSILPFFQEQLQRAQEPWKQIIITHAIGNLGTTETVSTLAKIVHGQYDSQVKASAIYSLVRSKLPNSLRDAIFDILMPLVSDPSERTYVRQASVATLLSWRPSSSWFQRLAVSTWREPSNNMAAFVYFMLRGLADDTDPEFEKQSKVAKFMLPLTKPYSPSWRYSYSYFYGRNIQRDYLNLDFGVSSMRDAKTADFPREIFTFILNSFGGLRFSTFKGSYTYENGGSVIDVLKKFSSAIPPEWKNMVRSASNRKAAESSSILKDLMNIKKVSKQGMYSNFFMQIFDNLEVLFPISNGTVAQLFSEGSKFFKALTEAKDVHLTKFLNPAPIEVLLPSEIGLPIFAKVSAPTVNCGEGRSELTVDGRECRGLEDLFNAKQIRLNITTNYKFATKTLSTIRCLLPWSQKLVGSGAETMKSLSLPVNLQVNVDKSSSLRNISLGITPTYNKEFSVLHAHTIPFVVIKSMWPGQQPKDFQKLEVISILGDGGGTVTREGRLNKTYSGLETKWRWEADIDFPFTKGNMLLLQEKPELGTKFLTSPTVRLFSINLNLDIGASETKEIHPSFAYETQNPRVKSSVKVQPKVVFKSPNEHQDSNAYAYYTNLLLNGTASRYYESSMKVAYQDKSGDKRSTKISLVAARNPLPNFDPNPSAYCLDLDTTSSNIHSLESLRKMLGQKQLTIDLKGSLRGGKSCAELEIAQIKANLKLSDERRRRLSKELSTVCNYDPADPMVAFRTAPVYDQGSLEIDYKEPVPLVVRNSSYHAYDVIRGYYFPYVYFNYYDVKNKDGQIRAEGYRHIGERYWNFDVKLPTEDVKFDRVSMPEPWEQIMPFGGLENQRYDTPKLLFESQTSNECVITKSQVRPFDGFSYNHPLEYCDKYAVVDRSDHLAMTLMTGINMFTGTLKGLIGSERRGETIFFNRTLLLLNSNEIGLTSERTVIKDSGNRYLAEARRTDKFTEVIVPGNFSVKIYDDKLWVTPYDNKKDKYGGLCGNHNGAIHRELVGPKDCLYTNPTLFGYSWTTYSGAGCDYHHYLDEQKQVKKFQENCKKAAIVDDNYSVLPKYDPLPHDCIEYVYMIKSREMTLCVSQEVVAMCHPLCKMDHEQIYNEVYNCWPEMYAPPELARYLKRGYMKNKIIRQEYVTSSFRTIHAKQCSRK